MKIETSHWLVIRGFYDLAADIRLVFARGAQIFGSVVIAPYQTDRSVRQRRQTLSISV